MSIRSLSRSCVFTHPGAALCAPLARSYPSGRARCRSQTGPNRFQGFGTGFRCSDQSFDESAARHGRQLGRDLDCFCEHFGRGSECGAKTLCIRPRDFAFWPGHRNRPPRDRSARPQGGFFATSVARWPIGRIGGCHLGIEANWTSGERLILRAAVPRNRCAETRARCALIDQRDQVVEVK